jgi:amino acid adenylation domain-containing protein/non-ribosomal peptide synthase protein (TIGR01720 family)
MKPIKEFLLELNSKDVKLWIEAEHLRCNAPKGVLTSEILTQLAERKKEIITFLQQAEVNSDFNLKEIIPYPRNSEEIPLSWAQERLWFLDQFEEQNATYNVPGAVRLTGHLNFQALQKTLSEITQRHEVLRTTFKSSNGTPVQVINKEANLTINVVDLQHLSHVQQETQVQNLASAEATTPFDLSTGPLLRVTLLKLSASESVVLFTMHHIISDGWSMGLFIQEISILYRAYSLGEDSPLPQLPIQYADFTLWQRQWLSKEVLENQLNYWQQQLAGAPALLELPTDHPRPPIKTYRGQTHDFKLNTEITQKLQTLCQHHGTTLFMTLLAAFATLLYRYSGQSDIVIGSPIANRNRSETESLIGFFVNTLVLKTSFESNPSFAELLIQVRELTLKAYKNQDIPFEQVVEALQPERSLSHSPLFQVMFVLQNTPTTELELPELTLTPLRFETATAKFDLSLSIEENAGEIVGSWEYNTDLFEPSTITRMTGHLQTLLSAIVENPSQRVGELPLLSAAERHQLLVEWNDTQSEYPLDKCIHQLFEQQVEKTPDAVAVVFEEQQLTYRQLNERSNQLAHYLHSLGVRPEILVGICLERSIEMLVGLLGILKAGAAYVPLDPSYPPERLAYMLEDSAVSVLLTKEPLLESLPQQQVRVVCLDTHWQVIEQHIRNNPKTGVTSDNLAYVIYTSGSTGRPKGVLIPHKNVIRLFAATQSWYHFSANDVWTNFHSIAFDFSVWEIWGALFYGGRLIIVPYWISRDSNAFYNLLNWEAVTVLNQTPSAFHQLIRIEEVRKTKQQLNLRLVIFGGEALELRSLKPWFEQHGDQKPQLVNMYGITETTVHVTYCPLTKSDLNSTNSIIGYPIPDLQMYILDEYLQPVPIGVRGQMYIGGDGLARGYLNRPELTQEKFIPNPFSDEPSARLYKTGDLARYLGDGKIEFLGRIDNQVKIRGFRIELGEIESVLNTHPQVQQTVVIATEDKPGNKRLVAYLATDSESLTSSELRGLLKERLPEYMVPSAFVLLDTLPLTPNGKIDRKALPKPTEGVTREQEYIAPRTSTEKALAHVWQDVLGLEQVSINDNFFEMGGDSILSIQVVSRAKNAGIQITPKQIFQHQTIAELAAIANTTTGVIAQQDLVTGEVPLTPIQKWFFEHNDREVNHYNQSVLLQIPNHFQPDLISTAVEKLLQHHDALRLRFTLQESGWQQINNGLDKTIPFEVVDLSELAENQQLAALEKIAAEQQTRLDLSSGPIMRVVLFNLGSECDARLLVIIHHLAVDGVSWRILLSDLESLYQQLEQKQAIQLPPKTTAFQDWAKKLREYGQSDVLKQELNYWLDRPWSSVKSIPVDYPQTHSQNTVASARNVSITLSVEQTRALLQEVNSAYNTQINDVLLTALVQCLAPWMGTNTILIDLEGHGREEVFSDVDLSRSVGWFTSIFPVLLQLQQLDLPGEALKLVKEQLRGIPHRGIGYGILRYLCEDTTISQQLQALPCSQISFNYLGQFDQMQSQEMGWKFAQESVGDSHSPKGNRCHLLDINALVVNDQLQINWTYSTNFHQSSTVENLAENYIKALQSLIAHCQSLETGGYTPSDFPEAQLNQQELDELWHNINNKSIKYIYALSPMQQGMLFHTLYAPSSGVYVEQMSLTLRGNLNVAAFKNAWQQIIDRHSVLRTLFIWENRQQPLQIVQKKVDLPWKDYDWQGLSLTEQQQHLKELLQAEREQGFQLNKAPLMQCTLIELADSTYKFIWTHHHILMDGWCLSIIFKEVLTFYEAYTQNQMCHLSPARPYRDYIVWLQQQDISDAREFWQKNLKEFNVPTPLVVDIPKYQRSQTNSTYHQQKLNLSNQVSQALQSLAKQHRLTLSTLVQAAWALLLSHYSGEQDVVFGVTVSGRPANLSGVEQMVGLFINTLPFRVQVSSDTELIPWLKQLQQQMVDIQQYSYTPLVDIQQVSEMSGGIPLFESIVVFENYPMDKSVLQPNSSLELSQVENFEQDNYPLSLLAVSDDKLSITINYDTSRFEEHTIKRMLGHLQTMFSAIADNPQQIVGEIPLLTTAERHQLLVEWNDTYSEYPVDKCIHQLFEQQVEETPDAVAVVFEEQQLTYRQLNEQSNQLAHYLHSLGVGPEVLVGLCVERSIQMLVGLLGILKAGAAYVPLDPTYPQERLNYMLEDSSVLVLLTQESLVKLLPQSQTQLVCLDSDWQVIQQNSKNNLNSGVTSTNLAYVIYTSGSTGKPKGVTIEHQSLVNHSQAIRAEYGLTYNDRILQFANFGFDIAAEEIFPTLVSGATLIMRYQMMFFSFRDLHQLIEQQKLTVLNLPTSYWQGWVRELSQLDAELPASLRLVIIGTEAVVWEQFSVWLEHINEYMSWCNSYGPTETTITSTVYKPTSNFLLEEDNLVVPIGRPIANTSIYILDRYLRPVPIGIPGELHIGGAGLARGYLNRSELTQEKFIPNPFSDEPSARLYKTGDLARYLPDGNIEFIGRIDNQVKIRGFRIELGEIESILNTHPQIQQAVVIATEDIPGNKRLVAYVVTHSNSLSNNQLRELLEQKLPEYMVPSVFMFLDTLPLTPNGKVDYKALPAPFEEISRNLEFVPPRTPTEELIANIFASVLGLQGVSIHDDFFKLGGHSLLATQLMSRIRQTFEMEVPLRTLFESPTVEQLNQALSELGTNGKKLSLPSIEPLPRNSEEIPLSWAQERLWFLDQLQEQNATYNLPGAVRFTGHLNFQALQKTLSEITQRHEVLRTTFKSSNGTPVQVINKEANLTINVVDLQHLPHVQQETQVQNLASVEATTPFDLSTGPLLRVTLLKLSASESVVLFTMHHIISDGWSMGLFIQEISILYRAYSLGEDSPLPQLPIQYVDFALWQRQWLSKEVLENQLNYWQQQLAGAPALLELPTDHPRPPVQTYRGQTHDFTLNTEMTQKLQTLCQHHGTTLFMTLLAAFATLLYRYSGQSDIVIGSPIANRNRSETESLIGFFVNTLVLKTSFESNPSFAELLTQVREVTLKAYENQDIPFEQVVEALQPERSLSHSPLFQVMFVLQNTPTTELELPELTLTPLRFETATAKFDLSLSIEENAGEIVGSWEYNTDLFEPSTITRMTGHLQTLLSAIVENPSQRVGELPLLSAAERHQLLVEWNDTQSEYPLDKCIHQLFEQQVEKTPDAVAVVFEEQQLTYRQLNERSNQLAHYLHSLGVRPEILVGICLERSIEMLVGLLGILKAGAAYVPLDPNYPPERLAYMLEDSAVSVLLTKEPLLESLPQQQVQVVCLDTHWQVIEQHIRNNPKTGVTSDNLAYVIYTSGSTGQPKGVLVTHVGLLNLVFWHQRTFDITSSDQTTQLAGIGFDATVWELWPYLSIGATIHLVKSETLLQPLTLRDWLVSEKITICFVPTPLLTNLLSLEWPRETALRMVLTGGDKLHQFPSASLPFSVINNYGPTENTVVATSGLIVPQQESHLLPSIGRPIANTSIYILDSHLQPLPIGVPGELHIGGKSLARGYFNRPELTQEKFIPHPFSDEPSARLYKTGDLARYLGDGKIEFLGRIDNQVKIRGFRIELGEIESVLNTHPQVQQTVVIATEDKPGNKRLVAYLATDSESLTSSELRGLLKERLPEYMVPSAFVLLDTLPLTPNGKIDRKALPKPTEGVTREQEYIAPRTSTEKALAHVWQDVLGLEQVSINDNFFEMGGDSILSIQVVSRAKNAGIQITPKQIFQHQTIAELAAIANTTIGVIAQQDLVTGEVPLTPIQKWFFEHNDREVNHYNQSVLLQIPNHFQPDLISTAVEKLLQHHDALRLRFTLQESGWQQINNGLDKTIPFEVVDLSELAENQQLAALEKIAAEQQTRLDLSSGPIMRVVLFNLGSECDARLLVIIHHLAVDGVSWRILLSDLESLYQQLEQKQTLQLPPKTTAFQDWAKKLREYGQSDVLKQELNYWLDRPWSSVKSIPVDYPQTHSQNTVASARNVSITLSVEQTRALLQEVNSAYNTQINDVLLTALVQCLAPWMGTNTILIDLEGHGREEVFSDVDLSRSVGWFTSIFPVLLQLQQLDLPGEALKLVKEQLRGIPHRGIGYGILRYLCEDTTISQQLQALPCSQISFNYLGQFDQMQSQEMGWKFAQESVGDNHSLKENRCHLLEINALVVNDQLQIDWTYSTNFHQSSTVENLAENYIKALQSLIAHCQSPETVGYTPSDFPGAQLNQQELDEFLAEINLEIG